MKKNLTQEALIKEATFWTKVTKAAKDNPGILCHK